MAFKQTLWSGTVSGTVTPAQETYETRMLPFAKGAFNNGKAILIVKPKNGLTFAAAGVKAIYIEKYLDNTFTPQINGQSTVISVGASASSNTQCSQDATEFQWESPQVVGDPETFYRASVLYNDTVAPPA